MSLKSGILIVLIATSTTITSLGNNLTIGIPTIVGTNIQFTLSLDNSWYTNTGPSNWDAVWIFVKRQSCADNLWHHSLLNTSNIHSVTGGLLQVDPTTDGMGVFVRRSSFGSGNIATVTITLVLQAAANTIDNFQVLGIEMISVPQGNFYIGDGTGGTSGLGFRNLLVTSATQTAGIGNASIYQSSGYGSTSALTSTFPLGWNNFYIMKYEISQEQYASFLNSLTFTQQVSRTAVSPASAMGTLAIANSVNPSRNRIEIQSPGVPNATPAVYRCDLNNNGTYNENGDGQDIACNWLSWQDLLAYLDWAAIRPMTEFEFEKATRGEAAAVLGGEYSWSSTSLVQAESGALNNSGQSSETSTAAGNGLCAYGANNAAKGPLRCGFAASASTTRAEAGGSYYGVMEMSGNVAEQCVGGANFNYSAFTSASGDGTLTSSGAANTTGWPANGGGQAGGVARGGDWNNTSVALLAISDRAWLVSNHNQSRDRTIGGRGVRNY